MRIAALAITAASMIAATSGIALADAGTDLDYLKASRCRGLDESGKFSAVDSKALDAYVKGAERVRAGYILERARNEEAKAKREARYKDRHERLEAELTGPCMAYMGEASPTATASAKSGAPSQN